MTSYVKNEMHVSRDEVLKRPQNRLSEEAYILKNLRGTKGPKEKKIKV